MKRLTPMLFLLLPGCGEPPNEPPTAVGDIPDHELFVMDEEEITGLSTYFEDPNEDTLTYRAQSADASVVRVAVGQNDVLTLTGAGQGNATVTVTATDPDGESATQKFDVTVPNRAPETVGSIPDGAVFIGDTIGLPLTVVDSFFTDPDGDDLTYSGESSDEGVATIEITGTALVVVGVGQGEAVMTVTATDPGGASASHQARIAVPNRDPVVTAEIPEQRVKVDETVVVDLLAHIEDPDGDLLTFTVSVSAPDRVRADEAEGRLRLTGLATGSSQVTVTAEDGFGASVSTDFATTVVSSEAQVFEDQFEDLENWADSTGELGTARVEDGDLHIIIDEQVDEDYEMLPYIFHELPGEDGHDGAWEIEYPVWEREDNAIAVVEFWVIVDRDGVGGFVFTLDYDQANWNASWMDEDGELSSIADGEDEEWPDDSMIDYEGVTDIVFGLEDNVVYARGNDGVEIFSVDMSGELPGGADPPHHAKWIAYRWYSYVESEGEVEFGTDGAVIGSVKFTYAK